MRNTYSSSKSDQVAEGLITLSAMRAAANSVKSSNNTASHARVFTGTCESPKIISLTDELSEPSSKGEMVYA